MNKDTIVPALVAEPAVRNLSTNESDATTEAMTPRSVDVNTRTMLQRSVLTIAVKE